MADPDRRPQIDLLLQRLERISADSRWAHLASGYRGSLLKTLDEMDHGIKTDLARLENLIDGGTAILHRAAHERIGNRIIRLK